MRQGNKIAGGIQAALIEISNYRIEQAGGHQTARSTLAVEIIIAADQKNSGLFVKAAVFLRGKLCKALIEPERKEYYND